VARENQTYRIELTQLWILRSLKKLRETEYNNGNYLFESEKIRKLSLLHLLVIEHYARMLDNVDIHTLIEHSEIPFAAINQLLENILYHSEYGKGVFLIRTANDEQSICIEIADASGKGVVDTFLEKLEQDPNETELLKRAQRSVAEFSSHIDKSRAFNSSKNSEQEGFWREYYSHFDGVALHRGLSVFLNSIKIANGEFTASTCSTEEGKRATVHYTKDGWNDTTKDEIVNSIVKGSRYSISYMAYSPRRQYSQIIDIDQEDRVKANDYETVAISVAEFFDSKESALWAPLSTQEEKNEFGTLAYRCLLQRINEMVSNTYDRAPLNQKQMLLILYLDFLDNTRNEAIIKNIGRLLLEIKVTATAKETIELCSSFENAHH
jgi:hypothetical protein